MGRPEGKRAVGGSRRICIRHDDIKMDLKEVGWGAIEWTALAQDRGRWQ